MSAVDLVGLIASIVSLVLAVGAIWLSVVFFRMSNEAHKATTEAAKGIDASVKRLENLFDKLYSDTFSMMKDTVSDMRKHIWSGGDQDLSEDRNTILEEADRKAEAKVAEVKAAMEQQLSEILARQRVSEGGLTEVRGEMRSLLEKAIHTSRQIDSEAREETVRDHIISQLRRARARGKTLTAMELVDALRDTMPPHRIVTEFSGMKSDGLISYDDDDVGPETKIRIPTRRELGDDDLRSLRRDSKE